jgi:hypothetical protein
MNTLSVSLVTLVAGALVSGVATYLGTRSKLVLDYDADLRQRRIDAYADLWKRLSPLAKYGRLGALTVSDVEALAESLRVWYFEVGGLFLSTSARTDYFALQELLGLVAGGWGWQEKDGAVALSTAAREYIRTSASRLRTGLTRDVGSRTQPKLPGTAERIDRSLAGEYEREDDGRRVALRFRPWMLGGTRRIRLKTRGPSGAPRIEVVSWERGRQTARAVVTDTGGQRRSRILVVEPGLIVEGPPPGQDSPQGPALWRRMSPPQGRR